MDRNFELYKNGQLDVHGMHREFGIRVKERYRELNRLPEKRGKEKLTQERLADILEVTPETVKSWCGGKALPKTVKLIELSRVLDCDPGYLLCTQNDPRKEYSDISNATGLSEASAERLKRWNTPAFEFVATTIDALLEYHDTASRADDPLYEIYSFLRQPNKTIHVAPTTGCVSDAPGACMQDYQYDDIRILRIGQLLRDFKRFLMASKE